MDSYRNLTYQIVIGTKNREKAIPEQVSNQLYRYLWGLMKKKQCHLFRINGIEDHLHLVCDVHPSLAIADLVKDLKVSSSKWMKESSLFPDFRGWAAGYGLFSYSKADRPKVIQYVRNQKIHHQRVDYKEEFRKLLDDFGIDYDERFLP